MKRLLVYALLLAWPGMANALTAEDASLVFRRVQIISNHINNIRDSDKMADIVASNAGHLKDVRSKIQAKSITFSQTVTNLNQLKPDRVKVEGTFTVGYVLEGKTITRNGSDYFIFQKQDNRWQLAETNVVAQVNMAAAGALADGSKASGSKAVWWLVVLAAAAAVVFLWRKGLLKRPSRSHRRTKAMERQPNAAREPADPPIPTAMPVVSELEQATDPARSETTTPSVKSSPRVINLRDPNE